MAQAQRRLQRTLNHLRILSVQSTEEPFATTGVPTPPARDPDAAGLVGKAYVPEPGRGPHPMTRDLDPPGADRLGLTPEEITHFKEKGYIVKRGLIPMEDLEKAGIYDLWWQQPPVVNANMSKDDPSTWVFPGRYWPRENRWGTEQNWMGKELPWPGEDSTPVGDGKAAVDASSSAIVGRIPHKTTADASSHVWRWHGIGHDPAFVNATSAHPNVLHMIEALLGGPVKRPYRNRGIYSVFPRDKNVGKAMLGPHVDGSPVELMAVTNLAEIGPRSGGFTIWPGSAQLIYPTSEQKLNFLGTKKSKEALKQTLETIDPWEFTGGPGDVVFCHGYTLHSAGIQESGNVRLAIIQDFNRSRPRGHIKWRALGRNGGKGASCDMDGVFQLPTDDPKDPDVADGNREVIYPWLHDSLEWVASRDPPDADIWADWNLGKKPVIGNVAEEPPWWEKYGLPMLPSPGFPRGGGGGPAVPLKQIATYEGNGRWRAKHRGDDWMKNLPRP